MFGNNTSGLLFGYSAIWKIAYPIIVGNLAQTLLMAIDTAFLGRLGEVALGASAIGSLLYMAIFLLGYGLGNGVQILIARKVGEGKQGEIGRIVQGTIVLLFIGATVFFLFTNLLVFNLLESILKSEAIFSETCRFLRVRSYGLFFSFINISFIAFYSGIGSTKIISLSTIVLAIINAFLDYCLIFGNFGFPKMGIEGAALASIIAEFTALLIFIIYTWLKSSKLSPYQLGKIQIPNINLCLPILRISWPIMIQKFSAISAWFTFFVIIEQMGQHELAISNIIRNLVIVIGIPLWGFSAATQTVISNIIGQKRDELVLKTTWMIIKMCALSFCVLIAITMLFRVEIISLYTHDARIIQDSMPVLYVVTGSMFLLSISMIIYSAILGLGNTFAALKIELINVTLYLSAAYFFVFELQLSLSKVWASEYVYALSLGIISSFYLFSGRWKHDKHKIKE